MVCQIASESMSADAAEPWSDGLLYTVFIYLIGAFIVVALLSWGFETYVEHVVAPRRGIVLPQDPDERQDEIYSLFFPSSAAARRARIRKGLAPTPRKEASQAAKKAKKAR